MKIIKKSLEIALLIGSMVTLNACGNQTKHLHHSAKPRTTQMEAKNVNYNKPSQNKPYPKKLNIKRNRMLVSIKTQRVYIQKKYHYQWKNIYIMYASTGSYNRTPRGKYRINGVKTRWFYDPAEHEGAEYGIGWHKNGVYLFHSTPANQHHQVIKSVAKDLGKKPSSYGCVHLTIPDAKYVEQNAPKGLRVIIY